MNAMGHNLRNRAGLIDARASSNGSKLWTRRGFDRRRANLARELHQLTFPVDDLIKPRPVSWPHQFRGSRI
jgi:hypothetical protein